MNEMGKSIFHMRPLDDGNGWAIDEYDGGGEWKRTMRHTAEGAVMDKQQAQRAVKKALNGATKVVAVNKAECGARCPEEPSLVCRRNPGHMGHHWYDAPPSPGPDWSKLKADVIERIDALAAIYERLDAPPEWRARIWNELALPNLRLLAQFCANISFTDDGDIEGAL
jgi:hypothetical protein